MRLNRLPGGAATGLRAVGSGFVLAAVLSLALLPLFGAWTLIGTAALIVIGILMDRGLGMAQGVLFPGWVRRLYGTEMTA